MNPGKNIRLFKNDLLERLTYVHPLMPIAFWGPVVSYCFAVGLQRGEIDLGSSLILFGAGLFVWTLSEYVLHRYVFHFRPRGKIQERIAFLIHGVHHEDPDDQRRLLMPLSAAVIIAVPFYVVFLTALGPHRSNPFFSGFLVGYLIYDYMHFAVHYWKFKSKVFMELKKNHLRHHFKSPDTRYGVSNTFWDHVFGTR